MALVKRPRNMRGIGMTKGMRATRTEITSSSAKTLPKSRKLRDSGLVKSSKILIGRRKKTGEI